MIVTLKDAVDHDGRRYVAGDVLDMADEQAEALLAADVAEAATDDAEPVNRKTKGRQPKVEG